MFSIRYYFIRSEYNKKSLQVSHLEFSRNICAFFGRIFEGIYMACKLVSSFVVFNVNFGVSILKGTLHSLWWLIVYSFCLSVKVKVQTPGYAIVNSS